MAQWWTTPEPDESFLQFRERSIRDGARLTYVVAAVVDGYKRVNDTRGHAEGDALLCRVAAALGTDLRPSDVLGRLGGDEFAVLLPEAGPGALRAAAARLDQRLGQVASASIGVASLPADGLTAEALHHAADAELYRAKERRGERVSTAPVRLRALAR